MTERQFDKPFDSTGIPQANRYEIRFCGACPNAHLIFYDYDDLPIAHATMSVKQARRLVVVIENIDPNFRDIEA
jgi:hypothetical protein